ncbi:hypothetical protein BDM02DRAFT_3112670 [Thelephora ganbajun]|uniref:Uncharacterized protein n=1 Tax=Thelephora ganbajun TaxID=370292 RepID=A0ACB6ZKD6_THEGA|nr:hypothetical protein BDM02DRAFT_3112670 [Thelephora ganbajun]
MKRVDDANEDTGNVPSNGSPQCRICFDGPDQELGRLIRPCLCKGSISHVHVKCLQKWRTTSASRNAFWVCPQCHYRYHFARTRVSGLASNPAVVAAFSAVIFTLIVYVSSFVTATCLGLFEQGVSENSYFFSYYFYPIDTFKDLVSSTLSILNDEFGIIEQRDGPHRPAPLSTKPDSLVIRLVKKFLLGLPLVGIGSLIQMILSMPILGPVHWIARYRSARGRRGSTRDTTAIIVVGLMLIGALRALAKVYDFTRKLAKRLLLRAEDIILEVG